MAASSRIVVGVDGSAASLVAVRYAAAEARRTGASLELVHASAELGPVSASVVAAYAVEPVQHRERGTRLLNRARAVAREVAGDHWSIRTTVLEQPAAGALAEASKGARALVIGSRSRTPAERLFNASVAAGLVRRASIPVLVVPEVWEAHAPVGVVGLALGHADHAERLLRLALELSAERSAGLEAVHVVEPHGGDHRGFFTGSGPGIEGEHVGDVLARLRHEHPHLDARVEVVSGDPSAVLTDLSRRVDLLVVAARRSAVPPDRLGATARAVLRDAACPVLLVPARIPCADQQRYVILDPELVD